MKIAIRVISVMVLLLVLTMSLAACDSSAGKPGSTTASPTTKAEPDKTGDELLLAYITHTTTNIYWDTVVKGFEAQCKEEGVKYITYDSGADAGTQLTQIEDCLSLGVDAVLLSPLDDASSLAMTNMCREAKVPILIVDIGTVNDVDFVVVSDNYGAGKMLGEHAIKTLGKDLKPVVITTPLGFTIGEQRTGGIVDYITGQGIKVLGTYTLPMGWDRADCLNATEDAITAFPEINALFCPNDDGAIGSIEALKAAGILDKVKVYGFDCTNEGIAAIESGEMTATIAQQPYLFGTETVKAALKLIKGETIEKNMDMPCALVTKDNVADYK